MAKENPEPNNLISYNLFEVLYGTRCFAYHIRCIPYIYTTSDLSMSSQPNISYKMEPIFPVYLLRSRIPDQLLGFLLRLSDHLLSRSEGDNSLDYSGYLAGHIKNGRQVRVPVHGEGLEDKELVQGIEAFTTLIKGFCSEYIASASSVSDSSKTMWSKNKITVNDMWVVSQLAGDFNPLHTHATTLSGIVYLKVPPQINLENYPAGWLNCAHGNSWNPMRLDFSGTMPILPEVGTLLLFPSWLNHEVYPFTGNGERRCLPFNVNAIPLGGGKF